MNTDYYVDATNGNDNNSGTITLPWQTLNKVNNFNFGEGDQILFKRGEVWNESLTIPSSGTALNPITFGAYDTGDLPIFNGTTTVSWNTPPSGNVYNATWANGDPGMLEYKDAPKPPIVTLNWSSSKVVSIQPGAVLIQKKDGYAYCNFWVTSATVTTVSGITFFRDSTAHWIANVTDSIELRQVEDGKEAKYRLTLDQGMHVDPGSLQKNGDWYWDSNTLYLYSDTDPTSIVRISDLVTGIYAENKQYLTIQDIAVQGFQDTGVHLDNTNNSIVQRMQVKNIDAKVSAPSHKPGILLH
ncbi:MAG: hypothetical protein L3J49_09495, partial [Desulfobulbaceae bacterium]|nr:hypothetical protein [Desulfobulbaceae bacterium]